MISIQKGWMAVDVRGEDEEVVVKAETRAAVLDELYEMGLAPTDYEVVAYPKSHGGSFL